MQKNRPSIPAALDLNIGKISGLSLMSTEDNSYSIGFMHEHRNKWRAEIRLWIVDGDRTVGAPQACRFGTTTFARLGVVAGIICTKCWDEKL
jgi:hypothetical protein